VMASPKFGPWWILWGFPQTKKIIGFQEVHKPKQLQVPRRWRKFKPIRWFICFTSTSTIIPLHQMPHCVLLLFLALHFLT
jgi:hypothetical protein